MDNTQDDPVKIPPTDTSEIEAAGSDRELAERLIARIRSRFLAVSKATHAAMLGDSDPAVLFMGIEAFTVETADDIEYVLRRMERRDATLEGFIGELVDIKSRETQQREQQVNDGRRGGIKTWSKRKPERERKIEASLLKEMKQLKKKNPKMTKLDAVRKILDKHNLALQESEDTWRVRLSKALESDR